jgi:hypothetical protein
MWDPPLAFVAYPTGHPHIEGTVNVTHQSIELPVALFIPFGDELG